MPLGEITFQSGESCLKSGTYTAIACTGFNCSGPSDYILTLQFAEAFPKCDHCGSDVHWKSGTIKLAKSVNQYIIGPLVAFTEECHHYMSVAD